MVVVLQVLVQQGKIVVLFREMPFRLTSLHLDLVEDSVLLDLAHTMSGYRQLGQSIRLP